VAYILIKEKAKEITGIEKHYDLLMYLRKNPNFVAKISEEFQAF